MAEVLQFVLAVLGHWQAYVTGGVLTAGITVIERWRGKPFSWRVFAIFLTIFLLVAFFLTWHDEHSALGIAVAARDALEKENVRIAAESKGKDGRIAELETKGAAIPKKGQLANSTSKEETRSLVRDLKIFQSERVELENAVDGTPQAIPVGAESLKLFQQRYSDRLRKLAAELPQYLNTESRQIKNIADSPMGGNSGFLDTLLEILLKVSASL